jgi:predicted PolB exonuclease-like 3'-5' exonuclease
MNQTLKKINEESILFFDTEDVRQSKELIEGSTEFNLYRKKIRNRETDELPSVEETKENYKKRGALKMCYTKIVSIGVGFIKDGKVHIKALEGSEEEIIRQFCIIANSFDYICGANVIAFDIPMIIVNGMRYFNVSEHLKNEYVTTGKKPWELKSIIDLLDQFRGTYYGNSSVDEMCFHFGLESSKSEIDGSEVSEEFWENGVNKINTYVKKDVFANVNIFKKMRFEQPFETFIDKNALTTVEPFIEELPILAKLHSTKQFNEEVKGYLRGLKIAKKDKKTVEKLVLAHYLEKIEVTAYNKAELESTNKSRTEEVEQFFKTLK